jgi:hypothetical protein
MNYVHIVVHAGMSLHSSCKEDVRPALLEVLVLITSLAAGFS